MPTGGVRWFDLEQRLGRMVASGRESPVAAADMETRARAAVTKAVELRWAKAASSGRVSATRDLYAVDVVLHAGTSTRRGRAGVPRWLLDHNLLAPGWQPDPHGQGSGDTFTITRAPATAGPTGTRIRVRHGQISEQWIDG